MVRERAWEGGGGVGWRGKRRGKVREVWNGEGRGVGRWGRCGIMREGAWEGGMAREMVEVLKGVGKVMMG